MGVYAARRRPCARRHYLAFVILFITIGGLVASCNQTLRRKYIDVSDPCSPVREPIVVAGDELDARQKQLANEQAAQQMKGHELPVVTRSGNQTQFNLNNALTNAMKQASLANQAYVSMKQRETGANAAALLASVEGDASNDRARLRSVTHAMQALRTCRGAQVAAARAGSDQAAPERLEKLRRQQAKLTEDDQLIAKVFGDYGNRAQMYADASSAASAGVAGREARARTGNQGTSKAPPRSSVQALKEDERTAQIADRKQSETLHETLQSSIAGT
jgi:hypothetical protein